MPMGLREKPELAQRAEENYRSEKANKRNINGGAYRGTTLAPKTLTISFQRETPRETSGRICPGVTSSDSQKQRCWING